MRESTAANNEAHYKALAEVEAFKNSGGKIKVFDTLRREINGKIKTKSTAKKKAKTIEPGLSGMSNLEKVLFLIKKYKTLTRDRIEELTGGMDRAEIFRAARKLQNDKLITREKREGTGFGRQVQFCIVAQ